MPHHASNEKTDVIFGIRVSENPGVPIIGTGKPKNGKKFAGCVNSNSAVLSFDWRSWRGQKIMFSNVTLTDAGTQKNTIQGTTKARKQILRFLRKRCKKYSLAVSIVDRHRRRKNLRLDMSILSPATAVLSAYCVLLLA